MNSYNVPDDTIRNGDRRYDTNPFNFLDVEELSNDGDDGDDNDDK